MPLGCLNLTYENPCSIKVHNVMTYAMFEYLTLAYNEKILYPILIQLPKIYNIIIVKYDHEVRNVVVAELVR